MKINRCTNGSGLFLKTEAFSADFRTSGRGGGELAGGGKERENWKISQKEAQHLSKKFGGKGSGKWWTCKKEKGTKAKQLQGEPRKV